MRAEHEAELESTVNKLKYQYSSKIESADEKISSLQEKERELASSLKNSELTRYNLEKSNKSSIYSLKRQIEKFEENVENLKSDISCEKAEKDKVLVDLQSRKAVWEENETDYLSQIKVLQVKLDAKNLQEQQLRSELSKFGSLMNVAEERYNVSSPDREQMRSIRKAKGVFGVDNIFEKNSNFFANNKIFSTPLSHAQRPLQKTPRQLHQRLSLRCLVHAST